MPNLRKAKVNEDITYFPEVFREGHTIESQWPSGTKLSSLPDHVESVRKALLCFANLIPETSRSFFEGESQLLARLTGQDISPPESAYLKQSSFFPGPSPVQITASKNITEEVARLERKAREQADSKDSKVMWASFLQSNVFKTFEGTFTSATSYEYLSDQWSVGRDVSWNEFSWDRSSFKIADGEPTTAPKPAFTYGFPIYKSNDHIPAGFQYLKSVSSFSADILRDFRKEGPVSSPVNALALDFSSDKPYLAQGAMICYPWAVVEIADEEIWGGSFRNSQNAVGASRALTLLEHLAAEAGFDSSHPIPPVVAFTCVGAEIRVWLAYSCPKSDKLTQHKMVCIWTGTLNSTWGVMALRQIVRNMVFWACRFLKPQISAWISEVCRLYKCRNSAPSLDNTEKRPAPEPTDKSLGVLLPVASNPTWTASNPQESRNGPVSPTSSTKSNTTSEAPNVANLERSPQTAQRNNEKQEHAKPHASGMPWRGSRGSPWRGSRRDSRGESWRDTTGKLPDSKNDPVLLLKGYEVISLAAVNDFIYANPEHKSLPDTVRSALEVWRHKKAYTPEQLESLNEILAYIQDTRGGEENLTAEKLISGEAWEYLDKVLQHRQYDKMWWQMMLMEALSSLDAETVLRVIGFQREKLSWRRREDMKTQALGIIRDRVG